MDLLDYYERNFYLLGGVMSELTDLEICKRIAEIEGLNFINTGYSVVYIKDGAITTNGVSYLELNDCAKSTYNAMNKYNPLTDDALCWRLMNKYKVDLEHMEDDIYMSVKHGYSYQNRNPNRAICLAIIEAHED